MNDLDFLRILDSLDDECNNGVVSILVMEMIGLY